MNELELREEEGQEPTLHGVIIQEGRAATGGRAELFAPDSVTWPADGVEIATRHLGPAETRAAVTRDEQKRLTIAAKATPRIVQAYNEGKRHLSVEFVATRSRITKGGVREILRAVVDKAAMVERPEYDVATAELRSAADIEERARLWL